MSSETRRSALPELVAMVGELRRLSAYTVLFNEAVAERLGITLTELKCSSLLDLHGAMTAGTLAEITGLTTGAITGVIDRLEKAKLARRVADPHDRRRVIVESLPGRAGEFERLYAGLGAAMGSLLAELDARQLATVRAFVVRTNTVLLEEAKQLRAGMRAGGPHFTVPVAASAGARAGAAAGAAAGRRARGQRKG